MGPVTAAQSVLGSGFRVLKERGRIFSSPFGAPVTATVHPSSVLRAPDPESRERAYADFVADLAGVVSWLHSHRLMR